MKKRFMSMLLAVLLLVGTLPLPANAAEVTVKEVIPCIYDDAGFFSEGLAPVKVDGKWGYINKAGKMVISPRYSIVNFFSEGFAWVELESGQYGCIDKTGKEVIPCDVKYDSVADFSEGLAGVKLNGKWGFINKAGREVIPCQFENAREFSEGFAAVRLDGKWGCIDKIGRELLPCKYGDVGEFSEGLVSVKIDGRWGFFDKYGQEVIPCQYDHPGIPAFSDGLALMELDDKIGFIDKTGRRVVPFQYDTAGDFSEGLARAYLDDKAGFIDQTGKEVIPRRYDAVGDFSDGLALATLDGNEGYIDKTGRMLVPPCQYDLMLSFNEGLAPVLLNDKWGYMASEDNTVAGFRDVFQEDYYADAVSWAVDNGVTAGTSDTEFGPNDSCTRAQAVTFLWRAAGRPEPTNTALSFTDVEPGSYYEKAVQWAVENRITAGTSDTTFSPNDTCTRGQIVSFLWRAHGRLDPTNASTSFTDVEAGAYYEKAVQWAVENRVTAGTTDSTFSPNDTCVRAQGVAFLWRAAVRPE